MVLQCKTCDWYRWRASASTNTGGNRHRHHMTSPHEHEVMFVSRRIRVVERQTLNFHFIFILSLSGHHFLF